MKSSARQSAPMLTAAMQPSRSRPPRACSPSAAKRKVLDGQRAPPEAAAPGPAMERAVNTPPRTLVIACGALAREIAALRRANAWSALEVRCLPAELHNRPERIAPAVREAIAQTRGQ